MVENSSDGDGQGTLAAAVQRVLRPLSRLMMAHGVGVRVAQDWLKEAYLDAAERHFAPRGKALSDSRLSVLTGLQRKDIKALRARGTQPATPRPPGPAARIIAHWRGVEPWRGADGAPRVLGRGGADGFDALVAEISSDVHPRTMLEEMKRLDVVAEDEDGLRLTVEAFVPAAGAAEKLDYLGANIGDHAAVAVGNVAGEGPARFERAVHYNRLTPAALAELERLARKLNGEALTSLNARALKLQTRDRSDPAARGRFRAGAYVLTEEEEDE